MKKIIKRAISALDPITGAIADTFNMTDKVHNAPSIRLVQEELNKKANTSHTHTKAQITDFSHTHDDRYFTETECNNKFKVKGDFAVLTGTITVGSSTSANKTINFPSGFTADNTLIIGNGIIVGTSAKGWNWNGEYLNSADGLNNAFHRITNIRDGGIYLSVTNPNTSETTFSYKIVIMKV